MKNAFPITLIALVAIACSGCHLRPNLGPPGTIGMQRSRAVLHDPYPIDELGPPVIGGRPKGFDRPQAEATNLQEVRGSMFGGNSSYQPAPNPAIQQGLASPPAVYPQYQPNF